MYENLPRGGQIVVIRPRGGREGVIFALFVVFQHHFVVQHFEGTPSAAEEIAEVVEVGSHIKGMSLTIDVEVNLLRDLEVDAVHPRTNTAVALRIFASVLAQANPATYTAFCPYHALQVL